MHITSISTLERLVLVRHSEAEKTLRRIHGGSGTPLTERGRDDTVDLAAYLRRLGVVDSDVKIATGPRPQAAETALILGSILGVEVLNVPSFRNIGMGVFDGLSDDEARMVDPEALARLEAWRDGRLSVGDIRIPEAEELGDFVQRIYHALLALVIRTRHPIIVCTRSVGIAVLNILNGDINVDLGNYRRYRLDPGSVTVLDRSETGSFSLTMNNETVYLQGERRFVDD